MLLYAIGATINFLVVTFLAFAVLAQDPRNKVNQTYALANLSVSFWSFFYIFWQISTSYNDAVLYLKLLMFGAAFMPVFLSHFIFIYTKQDVLVKRVLPGIYIIGLSFVWLTWKGMLFNTLRPKMGFPFWPDAGIALPPFLLFFFSIIVSSLFLLYRHYLKSNGIEKERTKYLLAGLITAVIAGSPNYALWYDIPIVPILNPLFSVYVGIIGYAITRYRLMGIEMILRKGMIYGLITAVMSVLYFIVIYLSEHFFKAVTGFSSLWFTIPAIFILALLFEPTMAFLQGAVDRTFFRSRYIAEKISRKFAEGVKKLRTIEDFAKFIARSAYVTLKLKGSAAFAFDERKGLFVCLEAKGSLKGLKDRHIRADDPCVSQMRGKKSSVMREEAKMPDDNIYLCVPSMSSGKSGRLLGFLAADTKRDNTPFSVEEIELLEMLANQTASGIENALLYEQQIATIEKSLKLEKLASLGEATAGVAHEAKNALGFVSAFAQMLLFSDDKPKLVQTHSAAFSNEVSRIKLILQGILDYSKQTRQVAERLDLKELAEETIVLVRDQAKGKNVIIDNAVEEGVHITADRNRMKQVLLNLFMNAIEAMASGGVLSISTERSGQDIAVKVADTGSGMTKETLRRIFEPFYTTKKHGTGLGLAIVKRIIEENNGRLTADSEPGKGTTFTLAFQT